MAQTSTSIPENSVLLAKLIRVLQEDEVFRVDSKLIGVKEGYEITAKGYRKIFRTLDSILEEFNVSMRDFFYYDNGRIVSGFTHALEASGKPVLPLGISMGNSLLSMMTLLEFGQEWMKKEIVPSFTAFSNNITCFSLSEVGAGSNVRMINTEAYVDTVKGTLTINTQSKFNMKIWVANATYSGKNILAIVRDQNDKMVCVVVPIKTPGVKIIDMSTRLGCNDFEQACIEFDHVTVPIANMFEFDMVKLFKVFNIERLFTTNGIDYSNRYFILSSLIFSTKRTFDGENPLLCLSVHRAKLFPKFAKVWLFSKFLRSLNPAEHPSYISTVLKAHASDLWKETIEGFFNCCGAQAFWAIHPCVRYANDNWALNYAGGDPTVLKVASGGLMMKQMAKKKGFLGVVASIQALRGKKGISKSFGLSTWKQSLELAFLVAVKNAMLATKKSLDRDLYIKDYGYLLSRISTTYARWMLAEYLYSIEDSLSPLEKCLASVYKSTSDSSLTEIEDSYNKLKDDFEFLYNKRNELKTLLFTYNPLQCWDEGIFNALGPVAGQSRESHAEIVGAKAKELLSMPSVPSFDVLKSFMSSVAGNRQSWIPLELMAEEPEDD